jgi:heme-degrading monooxygenase HmoA
MYIVIRRYVGNTELADQLAARADDIKALIEPIDGFRAYYLVRAEDGAASITVCDDRSGADESNRRAAAWIKENMPEISASPPEISAGEVVLSTAAMATA